MDPDGDATGGGGGGDGGGDDDDDDPDDDDDKDADEDDEPEDEDEEEKADNTTMEEEGWGDDGTDTFESVTLAAPSDTNFIQLRQVRAPAPSRQKFRVGSACSYVGEWDAGGIWTSPAGCPASGSSRPPAPCLTCLPAV